MRKAYARMLFVTLMIVGLAAPVFGQSRENEARKYLVRGMAAVEMAKNEAGLAKAAAEFKKAIEIAPNMAAAWYNLGLVQSKMGKLKDAIDSYRRYLILAPKAMTHSGSTTKSLSLSTRWSNWGGLMQRGRPWKSRTMAGSLPMMTVRSWIQ